MSPPLDNLSGPGKPLKAEAPDAAETAGLLRTGLARLADSRNTSLALESRFDQGMLCITLARMWQCGSGWDARRFLQPIAPLLARKATPQTARGRAATDRRELCRASLTYNAAHALCLAALRGKGYRASNRYIVFQVLPHTRGLGPEVWRVLDKCHNTRNLGEYEGLLDVDERLVADLISATQAVANAMQQ